LALKDWIYDYWQAPFNRDNQIWRAQPLNYQTIKQ